MREHEEIAEKAILLEKAKKALGSKEAVLKTKKDELDKYLDARIQEHIEKPFDPGNLRAVVRRYLALAHSGTR